MNKILFPYDLKEDNGIDDPIMDICSGSRTTVMGYFRMPEQTSPEQIREEKEDEFTERLDEIVERFERADCSASKCLIFTKKPLDAVEEKASKENFDLIFLNGTIEELSTALWSIGDTDVGPWMECVMDLIEELGVDKVIVYRSQKGKDDEELEDQKKRMDEIKDHLEDELSKEIEIDISMDEENRPSSGIERAMEEVDLLIMGETTGGSRIFGDRSRKLSKRLNKPIMVTRKRKKGS